MCTCLQYRLELYMGTYTDKYTHTKKSKYIDIQLYNCILACSTAHIRYTHMYTYTDMPKYRRIIIHNDTFVKL